MKDNLTPSVPVPPVTRSVTKTQRDGSHALEILRREAWSGGRSAGLNDTAGEG